MAAGLVYALIAALSWGTYLFALKRYFHGVPATLLTVLVNACAVAWYLPAAAMTIEESPTSALADLGIVQAGIVAGVIVMSAAAFLSFLYALEFGEVSYVAPISKIVPVFVLPIEVGLLGTVLEPLQVAGVVVATAAVYVANYRRGAPLDPFRRAATSRAAQLALLSAFCFAVSDVGQRVVLQELSLPVQLWVPTVLGGVALVLLPGAIRAWPRAEFQAAAPTFVAVGALVAFSQHTTAMAFQVAPASIASPIINVQAVVAVVLGGIVLREEAFKTRLVAATLAVLGVTLIALA